MKRLALAAVGLLLCGGASFAASLLEDESLRFGAGVGSSQIEGVSHSTVELFAGVDTLQQERFHSGLELGMLDTSDSGADGGWVAGYFGFLAVPDVNVFGRAGVDFGGAAGWLIGTGIGYFIERNMEVRMEWVGREGSTGLQLNLAYYPRRSPFP